jgi:hypothetical protein
VGNHFHYAIHQTSLLVTLRVDTML